jgi:hypothetical protein
MSFCLETYLQESEDYKILASRSGFKDCAKLIEKEAVKVIHVNPGEKILGARIIGLPPVPIGINEETKMVMIPYTKPCYGTAVVEIPIDDEELSRIKAVAVD